MNKSSTWTALRNPAFRRLWIATVISGTCVAAHDSAATWVMNISTGSPFLISLMSTVASLPTELPSESFFDSFGSIIHRVRYAPDFQIVLVRNFLFVLFISVIPALMPVVGLKELHLSPSNLGLLFTSMGAGSVIGAVFIIPWLRARLSPDCLTLLANLLLVLVYVLTALVRQTEVFFVVAALAGVGWTLSASELWVAAQRAMANWARGRMNATVIMISQGAMALGGVIWGSTAAIAGVSSTLLGAAVLFLTSLLLARRLSINVTGNLEETVSAFLSGSVEPEEITPIALTRELLAA
jgi:transmembrane secretion effector